MKLATIVIFALAFGITLALIGTAHSAPLSLSLEERLVPVVERYRPKSFEAVTAKALAHALAKATSNRRWAALLLTIAIHESGLSARIAAGDCKVNSAECDFGKAWGLWQVHKTPHNAAVWGSTDLDVQAAEASHLANGQYYRCQHASVLFPLSTLRGYAGRGCDQPFKGEDARVATYEKVLKRL